MLVRPVTVPPGRASDAARPDSTGDEPVAWTTGVFGDFAEYHPGPESRKAGGALTFLLPDPDLDEPEGIQGLSRPIVAAPRQSILANHSIYDPFDS